MIEELKKDIRLEDSASGYFEILYILSYIIGKKDSTIILDEPALNLHPIKIKQLANELKVLTRKSGNQVIVITHSPYLIPVEVLNRKYLCKLKKDNGKLTYEGDGILEYIRNMYDIDVKGEITSSNEKLLEIDNKVCIVLDEEIPNTEKITLKVNEYEEELFTYKERRGKDHLEVYSSFIPNIIYVKRNGDSKAVSSRLDSELSIKKPHRFRSEVFFSKCNIIVEGPSDQAVLMVISDNLNGILEENDISIINVGSKDNIPIYVNLFKKFKDKESKDSIPYIIMRDLDNNKYKEEGNDIIFNGKEDNNKKELRVSKDNIILLEQKLEDELNEICSSINNDRLKNKLKKIWNYGKHNKIEENEAYEFVDTLMKDEGREEIKKSKFYQVLEKAFKKIGKEEELIDKWNKLNS